MFFFSILGIVVISVMYFKGVPDVFLTPFAILIASISITDALDDIKIRLTEIRDKIKDVNKEAKK
jgi:hypothetical protein